MSLCPFVYSLTFLEQGPERNTYVICMTLSFPCLTALGEEESHKPGCNTLALKSTFSPLLSTKNARLHIQEGVCSPQVHFLCPWHLPSSQVDTILPRSVALPLTGGPGAAKDKGTHLYHTADRLLSGWTDFLGLFFFGYHINWTLRFIFLTW